MKASCSITLLSMRTRNRTLLSEEGAVAVPGEDLDLAELIRMSKEPAGDAADSPTGRETCLGRADGYL